MLQQCTIKAPKGALGLNLSRAPWDPYPWVSGVQAESNAQRAGVCIGDTLLQLNGIDVLGMRISELATRLREHWLTGADQATMMMWRQQPSSSSSSSPTHPSDDPTEAAHAVQHGVNQQSLQKFATCLQHIAQLLECPVCCEVIKPPGWQCCNGHVLCNNCRNRSVKCPVCRVPLGPRGRCLLSDKLFTLLAENFPCDGVKPLKEEEEQQRGKQLEKQSQKCTNEYHNQPKMALAKSGNTGKKCKKTARQPTEDAVILVVSAAGREEAAAEGVGAGAGAGAGAGQEQCVMPKGNEQSAQIRNANNVNGAGLQCVAIKRQEEQQQREGSEELLQRETELRLELQPELEHNNMLVKPKLKLSKKSWQITGRDQDELRWDEVANINNGQQRSPLWQQREEQGQGQGQVLHCSHPQQYQNYHCSTGKSASSSTSSTSSSSSSDEAKLSQSSQSAGANKLSTVKRATTGSAAAGATAAEIALAAAEAAGETASRAGHSPVWPGRGHQ